MRALWLGGDGPLLRRDYAPPQNNEALIRPLLVGICNTDLELVKGYMGFTGVLGHEFVGIVEEAHDTALLGKRVVGEINCACGKCSTCAAGHATHCPHRTVLGIQGRGGAMADRFRLPERNLHLAPDSLSDEVAVFTEPLAAALRILEQAPITPDHTVALLGDGKLGLLIAQVLSTTGAAVTLYGRHPKRSAFITGVSHKPAGEALKDEALYDSVIDATGAPEGFTTATRMVKPRGTIILKTTISDPGVVDQNSLVINEVTVLGSRCGSFKPALAALVAGSIQTEPLVSAVESLDNALSAVQLAASPGVGKVLLKI